MPKEFTSNLRIYYKDTDAYGIVYYARYLEFLEIARTEIARDVGFSFKTIEQEDKLIFPVVSVSLKYKQPALLDDLLTIKTSITEFSNIKIQFYSQIFNEKKELLLEGTVGNVSLNTNTFKIQKMPPKFKERFKAFL